MPAHGDQRSCTETTEEYKQILTIRFIDRQCSSSIWIEKKKNRQNIVPQLSDINTKCIICCSRENKNSDTINLMEILIRHSKTDANR